MDRYSWDTVGIVHGVEIRSLRYDVPGIPYLL